MSVREKETIHQVVLPDFGPPSLPKRPPPAGSDPASLVDQVNDRVTVGAGSRSGSHSAQNRSKRVLPKQSLDNLETADVPENSLAALDFPTVAELEKYLSPIDRQSSSPHRWRLLIAGAIVGIVIVVVSVAIKQASHPQRETASEPQKNQKKAPTLPSEPIGKPLQLPSFVQAASLDAAYTRSNPGWERYMTNETEFRVFREGSAIRALQAIDLTGKGIPEEFAKKALAEVADLTEAVPRTTERKGGYLIERSQPSPVTRAVLYRKDSNRQIRAFVVYFD
jgi:hypothetical protein